MIHLFKRVYADYTFTGSLGRDNVIHINTLSQCRFTHGIVPLDTYRDLDAVIEQYGDLTTFFECLMPLEKKVHLLLDEVDLNRLQVGLLLTLFPAISEAMIHRIIKLSVVNHKYEHARRSNTQPDIARAFTQLTIPSREQIKQWVAEFADLRPLEYAFKRWSSFEHLLAHSLAVDFTEKDDLVQSFMERMETMLWKSIAWDFVGVRRDILYGLYNIEEHFGYAIDLERDDIEEQIAHYENSFLFNIEAQPNNIEMIKAHVDEILHLTETVQYYNQSEDRIQQYLLTHLPSTGLTTAVMRDLIEMDRGMHCTQLFGRTEFRSNVNHNFIGFLYQADQQTLQELRLQ